MFIWTHVKKLLESKLLLMVTLYYIICWLIVRTKTNIFGQKSDLNEFYILNLFEFSTCYSVMLKENEQVSLHEAHLLLYYLQLSESVDVQTYFNGFINPRRAVWVPNSRHKHSRWQTTQTTSLFPVLRSSPTAKPLWKLCVSVSEPQSVSWCGLNVAQQTHSSAVRRLCFCQQVSSCCRVPLPRRWDEGCTLGLGEGRRGDGRLTAEFCFGSLFFLFLPAEESLALFCGVHGETQR